MSEMVERVARFLYKDGAADNMIDAMYYAENVIHLMREPTEEMQEAGVDALIHTGNLVVSAEAETSWQAMIDAALK